MSDVFQEVDEEVRQDAMMALWQRYKWVLLGAIFAVVAGTAGWTWWQAHEAQTRRTESTAYLAALEKAQADAQVGAQAFGDLAVQAGAGYRTLARFAEAANLRAAGKRAEAVAVLDRIIADADADGVLRDLASLKAAYLLIDEQSVEEIDLRLLPLLKEGGAWRYSAWELQALNAYRSEKFGIAKAEFTAISQDAGTPAAMQRRAEAMLEVMGQRESAGEITIPELPAVQE